jgi:hypothetical protein
MMSSLVKPVIAASRRAGEFVSSQRSKSSTALLNRRSSPGTGQ